jgi:hypothetical protein
MIPIVFVETGRRPSKYLKNNLIMLREKFPHEKIILITSAEFAGEIRTPNVEIVSEETLPESSLLNEFESIQKNWSGLQKNYWTNTTKRFFVLARFLEARNLDKIIHLESDCVLLNDKWVKREFELNDWGLKYPKQHNSQGCASILLINKKLVFNNFLKFVIRNWGRGEITDMDLLSEFVSYDSEAKFLPSANNLSAENSNIYDGVSIGMFFMGTDARNQRLPFSARGIRSSNPGTLSLNSPSIRLSSRSVLIYEDEGFRNLELNNIHIHSKRIPRNYKTLERRLVREANCSRGKIWKLGAFDRLIFTERLVSFLYRRFSRRNSFEFRLR